MSKVGERQGNLLQFAFNLLQMSAQADLGGGEEFWIWVLNNRVYNH